MKQTQRITYAIFASHLGKGYGCFAIDHIYGSNEYKVAATFCHPNDRTVFSKEMARKTATNRLNSAQHTITVMNENNDFGEIIQAFVENSQTKTPSWARRAVVVHTLRLDNLSNDEILDLADECCGACDCGNEGYCQR